VLYYLVLTIIWAVGAYAFASVEYELEFLGNNVLFKPVEIKTRGP